MRGAVDAAVFERIIAESHGNPLALIELPRTWHDLAGGFGLPASRPVHSRVEQSYAQRLLALPLETRVLVLAAAAEPSGDPVLLQRAAAILGLDMAALGPAMDAGLLDVAGRVEFAHPLARSAAYHSGAIDDRHRVHGALAEATDAERDPDRSAWHRARATRGLDEDVAVELECSADRAQARGGLAAAAAFLERAAALSPDPVTRARRVLAAAEAKEVAGAPGAALALLAAARDGPLDDREAALARRLEGQIDLDLRRIGDAVPSLLEAAGRLAAIEPRIARDTYLEAIRAAHTNGRFAGGLLRRAAHAARDAPPPRGARDAFDLLLAGMALRFTDGYVAARRCSSGRSGPCATRTAGPGTTFAGRDSPASRRSTCSTTRPAMRCAPGPFGSRASAVPWAFSRWRSATSRHAAPSRAISIPPQPWSTRRTRSPTRPGLRASTSPDSLSRRRGGPWRDDRRRRAGGDRPRRGYRAHLRRARPRAALQRARPVRGGAACR